jgi:hypothetical protein
VHGILTFFKAKELMLGEESLSESSLSTIGSIAANLSYSLCFKISIDVDFCIILSIFAEV